MPSPLRIRFLKTASGPGFGPFMPGQEAELPHARARDLIDSGSAMSLGSVEPEHDEPEEKQPVRVERAVRRQPEAAVAPPQREQRDPGGSLPPGGTKAHNLTGAPEPVVSVKPSDKK